MPITKTKVIALFGLVALGYAAAKAGYVGRARAWVSDALKAGPQVVRPYNPVAHARTATEEANRRHNCYQIALADAADISPKSRTDEERRTINEQCKGLYVAP